MYLMDDHIFEEGDKEDRFTQVYDDDAPEVSQNKKYGLGIFFIIQGQIILFHK